MLRQIGHFFQFLAIVLFLFPFRFLPLPILRFCGRCLGSILYYFHTKFRKRALSNLALATSLHLNPHQIRKIAKQSFQNLCITALEYGKFKQVRNIASLVTCENPEIAENLLASGKGVIFFCAHQANWEVLFLEGTSRMPGVAIGRPVKNAFLYKWILSVRERFGGKIIPPKRAVWEGLRALKQRKFLGIVGDQGMPSSEFESLFLGRRAYTSTIPALLACKADAALITALVWRVPSGYKIRYCSPSLPNQAAPLEEEVRRLMEEQLSFVEQSIVERPGEWLWQHNRWKQETPGGVFYRFRHESILIVSAPSTLQETLLLFRKIYPKAFLTFYIPEFQRELVTQIADEIITYEKKPHFLNDYRFKLVFDLFGCPALQKMKKLSAFDVFQLKDLEKIVQKSFASEKELIAHTLCRGGVHFAY